MIIPEGSEGRGPRAFSLDHVPFDVLDPEDPVYVSVGQLFSHLDHGIMADIDRRLYDRAFRVNHAVGSGRLNHQTTALRLLHDLYFVDPDLVTRRLSQAS